MPQFLVLAYDGDDAAAADRRRAARPAHFEGIRPLVDSGALQAGGALLDEAGAMVGSVVMVEFPDRAALDAWLARDPYVTGGVWQRVEVRPLRLSVLAGQVFP